MTQGVDLAYDSGGLRAGAADLRTEATAADTAGATLQGQVVEAAMFGRTDAVAPFAAAVAAAQAAHARGFRAEGERAGDLARSGDATAGLGDQLVTDTAATARSGGPAVR